MHWEISIALPHLHAEHSMPRVFNVTIDNDILAAYNTGRYESSMEAYLGSSE